MSNRYGLAAAFSAGRNRSATPPRSATNPHASFGASASACASSRRRTAAGITTRVRRPVAAPGGARAHPRVAGQWLGCRDDEVREALAQPLAGAHQRPAGAEAGDEDVDAVERLRDLGAGALVMGARVRLVRVLEG